jgi:lincosamide nucleotidyltransferase A/C/D/E
MDDRAGPGATGAPETTAEDVVALLDVLDGVGIRVWLDGGWAVDACLGEQTRPHADLDIVIEERHLETVVDTLHGRGYRPLPRDDTRPWNFVLGDTAGHQVDFHVIVIDAVGRGRYGPPELDDFCYEAEALAWTGTIGGHPVSCMPPEWLVRWHTGYELDAFDIADVTALCERFAIPLPDEYARLRASINSDAVAATSSPSNRGGSREHPQGIRHSGSNPGGG